MEEGDVLAALQERRKNRQEGDHVDFQQPLVLDMTLLEAILFQVVRKCVPEDVYEKISEIVQHEDSGDIKWARKKLHELDVSYWPHLARTLRIICAIGNTADKAQKKRRRDAYERTNAEDSDFQGTTYTLRGSMEMFKQKGMKPEDIYQHIANMHIDFVLTAHPTETHRLTSLMNHKRLCELLLQFDGQKCTPFEEASLIKDLEMHIATMWHTDQIRRQKPTLFDEIVAVAHRIKSTIFDSVPKLYEYLDAFLEEQNLPPLPLDTKLFTFSSWAGGDRDGNPFVTPDITRQTVCFNKIHACDLYLHMMERLAEELPLKDATDEFKLYTSTLDKELGAILGNMGAMDGIGAYFSDEFTCMMPDAQPDEVYRTLFRYIGTRLTITRYIARKDLANERSNVAEGIRKCVYNSVTEIMEPLKRCYASLCEVGCSMFANSRLKGVIRCLETFGLYLLRLDIRQDSSKHTLAADYLFKKLGLSNKRYSEMLECDKVALLSDIISQKGQFEITEDMLKDAPDGVDDVIGTFKVVGELGTEVINAYVISMCQEASDVLLVATFLEKISGNQRVGVSHRVKIVPLLETIGSLRSSSDTMKCLFGNPCYRDYLITYHNSTQEVMIGYSDSGKDGGRLAASWELYKAQQMLYQVAEQSAVKIRYFHGRGGSISRGGGPLHHAIMSQPRGTLNNYLRLTVQGETIGYMFALPHDCLRTMEYYLTSCIQFNVNADAIEVKPEWIELWDEMAEISYKAYRKVVRDIPGFPEYFTALTPVKEMKLMNIGSRPAKRTKDGGIDTIRAIPWVFGWTQVQLNMPIWLGLADGLQHAISTGQLELLKDMYRSWPFCSSFLHLVSMVLLKTNANITEEYEKALVPQDYIHIGEMLRTDLMRATNLIKQVTCEREFCDHDIVVRRGFRCNARLLGPCAALQIETLVRYRNNPEDNRYHDALVISMKAIAAIMQHTG